MATREGGAPVVGIRPASVGGGARNAVRLVRSDSFTKSFGSNQHSPMSCATTSASQDLVLALSRSSSRSASRPTSRACPRGLQLGKTIAEAFAEDGAARPSTAGAVGLPQARRVATPSEVTSHENWRVQECSRAIAAEGQRQRSGGDAGRVSSAGRSRKGGPRVADLQEPIASLDRMVAEAAARFRDESVAEPEAVQPGSSHDDHMRAERELAREARQPRKKVEARLESGRHMHSVPGGGGPKKVPMVEVNFFGHNGSISRERLVNVLGVQAKCGRLDHSASVGELLEEKRRADRYRRNCRAATLPLPLPGGSEDGLGSPAMGRSLSTSERLSQVRARKNAVAFESMLKKLHSMRSAPTDEELMTFEAMARQALDDERSNPPASRSASRPITPAASQPRPPPLRSPGGGRILSEEHLQHVVQDSVSCRGGFLLACEESCSFGLAQVIARTSISPGLFDNFASKWQKVSDAKAEEALASPKNFKHRLHKAMKKRAVTRNLNLWRGITNVLRVYLIHKTHRRAGLIVHDFVEQLRQIDRVKYTVHRACERILLLTRFGRKWVKEKRQRIAGLHRLWQQVEDRRLIAFFEQRVKSKDDPRRVLQEKFGGLSKLLDWKKLRIPERERAAVINRYYSVQLRKAVERRRVMETWDETVKAEEEIYDVSHGVQQPPLRRSSSNVSKLSIALTEPEAPAPVAVPVQAQKDFWHLSDETIASLIAVCAHQIREMSPFQFHPANLEPKKTVSLETGPKERTVDAMDLALGEVYVPEESTLTAAREVVVRPDNMDMLLNGFTPRHTMTAGRAESDTRWCGASRRTSAAVSVVSELLEAW